jgi:cytidylate kinase
VFLAGGPGSGKSFVAKNILGGTGLRSINSDEVYEFLMKKQGLSLDPETIFSPQGQEIRDKAKGLARQREATYLDGRIGLIIDGTGKDVSKYQVMAQKLRAIGYDVSMIYVNTSLEVAQQRNKQRERSIKPAEVEKMWNNVQQNLMQFQQIFGAGRFHIIDNSGGLEDLDRQKNFDKVYVETQRFLNTPPKNRKALAWIQKQKEQNDGQRSAQQPTNQEPDGGTTATN